jgi:hypothetical protein
MREGDEGVGTHSKCIRTYVAINMMHKNAQGEIGPSKYLVVVVVVVGSCPAKNSELYLFHGCVQLIARLTHER